MRDVDVIREIDAREPGAARSRFLDKFPGIHMDRLLVSLDFDSRLSQVRRDLTNFDALAVLASAGQYLLGATRRNRDGDVWRGDLLIEDWQAAMTLLRLYNSIENGMGK